MNNKDYYDKEATYHFLQIRLTCKDSKTPSISRDCNKATLKINSYTVLFDRYKNQVIKQCISYAAYNYISGFIYLISYVLGYDFLVVHSFSKMQQDDLPLMSPTGIFISKSKVKLKIATKHPRLVLVSMPFTH